MTDIPQSEFIAFLATELFTDADIPKLLPRELGIFFSGPNKGAMYFRDPNTGELFSPNKLDASQTAAVQAYVADQLNTTKTATVELQPNVSTKSFADCASSIVDFKLKFNPNPLVDASNIGLATLPQLTGLVLESINPDKTTDVTSVEFYDDEFIYFTALSDTVYDELLTENGSIIINKSVGIKKTQESSLFTIDTTNPSFDYASRPIMSDSLNYGPFVMSGLKQILKTDTHVVNTFYVDSATNKIVVICPKGNYSKLSGFLAYPLKTVKKINMVNARGALRLLKGGPNLKITQVLVGAMTNKSMFVTCTYPTTNGGALAMAAKMAVMASLATSDMKNDPRMKKLLSSVSSTPNPSTVTGELQPSLYSYRSGKSLFSDPKFLYGMNGITVTAPAVATRIDLPVGSPVTGKAVSVAFNGLTADTGKTISQLAKITNNGIYVMLIFAKLTKGAKIRPLKTGIKGTGYVTVLSSDLGTGKFEWYSLGFYQGDDGNYSEGGKASVGAFTIDSDVTNDTALIASCNMYDGMDVPASTSGGGSNSNFYGTTTSTVDNHYVITDPTITEYKTGNMYTFIVHKDSTGACFFKANSLNEYPISNSSGEQVTELKKDMMYTVGFTGVLMQIQGGSGGGGGGLPRHISKLVKLASAAKSFVIPAELNYNNALHDIDIYKGGTWLSPSWVSFNPETKTVTKLNPATGLVSTEDWDAGTEFDVVLTYLQPVKTSEKSQTLTGYVNVVGDMTEVTIPIGTFDKRYDDLTVVYDSDFLQEGLHYNIGPTGGTIQLISWNATKGGRFLFKVRKDVTDLKVPIVTFNGNLLEEGTVRKEKLHTDLQDYLNVIFEKVKASQSKIDQEFNVVTLNNVSPSFKHGIPGVTKNDVFFININGTPQQRGSDYTVSEDGTDIIAIGTPFNNKDVAEITVLKNVNMVPADYVIDGTLIKFQSVLASSLSAEVQAKLAKIPDNAENTYARIMARQKLLMGVKY